MLLVLFSEVSPSIRSENARTEYLSGIKKGSLKNFTEKDGQEIGDDAYGTLTSLPLWLIVKKVSRSKHIMLYLDLSA